MEVRGVRNSWEMEDRNSSFILSSTWSSWRASWRRLVRRRTVSSRLRLVASSFSRDWRSCSLMELKESARRCSSSCERMITQLYSPRAMRCVPWMSV